MLIVTIFSMTGCTIVSALSSSNPYMFNIGSRTISSPFIYVTFSDPSLSKFKEYFQKQQYGSATDEVITLSSEGNTNAMFINACMYLYFSEGQQEEGLKLLEKSSELNNGFAAGLLAEFWHTGSFVNKIDESKSLKYAQIAYSAGVAEGYTWLGTNYIYNNAIKDIQKGIALLNQGEQKGSVDALYELAKLHRDGIGYSQNSEKAISIYRKIAEQDIFSGSNAYLEIGNIFENGIGVTKNAHAAEEYYTKAIKRGNFYGYCRIGMMYVEGKVVKPNTNKVDELYDKAEKKGINCRKYEDLMYEGHKI